MLSVETEGQVPFLRSVSIQYLLVLIPSILGLGIAIVLILHHYLLVDTEAELRAQRTSLAKITAGSIAEPLWNFDDTTVSVLLSSALRSEDVMQIDVLDSRGSTVVSLQNEQASWRTSGLQIREPIYYSNGHITETAGSILIQFSMETLSERVFKRIASGIWVILGSILATFIVSLGTFRWLVLKPLGKFHHAIEAIRQQGRAVPVQLSTSNEFGKLAKKFNDMQTKLDERAEQLRCQAVTDPLTGLPNRSYLSRLLNACIADAPDRQIGVCIIDLDDFKKINDGFGHDVGDQLLVEIANRLREAATCEDVVVRLGGDEFALIAFSVPTDEYVQRLVLSIEQPVEIDGREIQTSASIGVAQFPRDGTDLKGLLIAGDLAMYDAKRRGKRRLRRFHAHLAEEANQRVELERDIAQALEEDLFHLHYQNIVHLDTGTTHGYEALIRLHHPVKGSISPGQFIPVAEQSNRIVQIGNWVLARAVRDLVELDESLPVSHPYFSVNVSARQLDTSLIHRIEQELTTSGLNAQRIVVEITETAILEEQKRKAVVLHELQNLGCKVALDDFGTGYSSLTQLHELPLDMIKIDRSFVVNLVSHVDTNVHRRSMAIISGLAHIAKKLGIAVVAEGIETPAQARIIREFEIEYAQGYLFSKPQCLSRILAQNAFEYTRYSAKVATA